MNLEKNILECSKKTYRKYENLKNKKGRVSTYKLYRVPEGEIENEGKKAVF